MSRSKRKPWNKDTGTFMRIWGNRAFRRRSRQISRHWAKTWIGTDEFHLRLAIELEDELWYPDEEPVYPLLKEIIDDYDICDWRSYKPHELHLYRK